MSLLQKLKRRWNKYSALNNSNKVKAKDAPQRRLSKKEKQFEIYQRITNYAKKAENEEQFEDVIKRDKWTYRLIYYSCRKRNRDIDESIQKLYNLHDNKEHPIKDKYVFENWYHRNRAKKRKNHKKQERNLETVVRNRHQECMYQGAAI